ncbi:MAG: TauD/TfdA family dioxygenase [Gammaproteobacteria bacterium]|nr:TauD/TfdA family dioxygenase [Gammaproteobacteria bacterium]
MEIVPSGATLGATVRGIHLDRPLDPAEFDLILSAWHAHGVLVFPDQHLTDAQHLAFTRRFGHLEFGLRRSVSTGLGRLTNVTKEGDIAAPSSLQARFLLGNTYWHTDSSYKRVGAKASLLAARVVPGQGGETEWADMRAAYDVLDDSMQAWLEEKVAVHSYVFSHTPFGGLEILNAEDLARLPPVEHLVIKTHPETGRRNLFVGRHASHILGEDLETSRALLRKLTDDACQPPRIWKYRWREGDIAIWDNRCVLHRGHRWPDDQPRTMVRTTVAGDEPDNEWVMDAVSPG